MAPNQSLDDEFNENGNIVYSCNGVTTLSEESNIESGVEESEEIVNRVNQNKHVEEGENGETPLSEENKILRLEQSVASMQIEMSSKVEEMKALIEQSTATDYMGDNRPTLEQESRSAEKFYTLDEETHTLMMFSKSWSKL